MCSLFVQDWSTASACIMFSLVNIRILPCSYRPIQKSPRIDNHSVVFQVNSNFTVNLMCIMMTKLQYCRGPHGRWVTGSMSISDLNWDFVSATLMSMMSLWSWYKQQLVYCHGQTWGYNMVSKPGSSLCMKVSFFMECLENKQWHLVFDPLADRQNCSTME